MSPPPVGAGRVVAVAGVAGAGMQVAVAVAVGFDAGDGVGR